MNSDSEIRSTSDSVGNEIPNLARTDDDETRDDGGRGGDGAPGVGGRRRCRRRRWPTFKQNRFPISVKEASPSSRQVPLSHSMLLTKGTEVLPAPAAAFFGPFTFIVEHIPRHVPESDAPAPTIPNLPKKTQRPYTS